MPNSEYDISEYTDKEIYDILDLVNPSDRELEAKIMMKTREYNISNRDGENDGIIDFLNQIYHHFFEESEEEEEKESVKEGFTSGPSTAPSTAPSKEPSTAPSSTPGPMPQAPGTQGQGPNATALQVTTVDYPKGNLNPQPGGGKEIRQRTIVINSVDRDRNLYPLPGVFTGNLDETLFNVVALKFFAVSIPYSWYNVTKEYGANFVIISGMSPGINNGNFNYKLQIQPGQYILDSAKPDYDIIAAVQTGIVKMKETYSDVNFGTTDISLNYTLTPKDPYSKPRTKKATFIFDIQNIYDSTNYYLYFPTWSNPFGSDRLTTIPGYLGILYTNIIPSAIYSNKAQSIQQTGVVTPAGQPVVTKTFDLTSTIFKVYYDDVVPYLKSSYFTIYNYQDNTNEGFSNNIITLISNITEGSTKVSVTSTDNISIGSIVTGNGISTGTTVVSINNLITPTITISQAALTTATLSLSYISPNVKDIIIVGFPPISTKKTTRPVGYTRIDLITVLNTTLATNLYLDKSSSVTIENIRYSDSGGNITTYQQFKLNIVLNRKKTTQLPNMKQYIAFPTETGIDFPVWTGSTSCFLFNRSQTEMNNINSTNSPASIRYLITSAPTIVLTCTTDPLYSYPAFSLPAPLDPALGYTKQEYIQAIQTAFQTGVGATNILFFSIYEDTSATTASGPSLSQSKLVIKLEIYRNIGGGKNLSELDYTIGFQDTISPTSWFTNLGLESQYIMKNKPQHLLGNSYSQITATNPIRDVEIVLSADNNTFNIQAIPNTTGGAYTIEGVNDVNITIPPGTYTKTMLYQAINTALSNNVISNGSIIQSNWSTNLQTETTRIRLNINKIFKAHDYVINFHDDTLFIGVSGDLSGRRVLKPLPWVATLGWLLGFHSYATFYLMNENNPNLKNYEIYNRYSYDSVTGIVTLTGDVKVDVETVKNIFVVIDDHIQNQMNDGLVTLGPKDTNTALPDYSTGSNIRLDPVTNKPMINLLSASNPGALLTEKQLYAAQVQIPVQGVPSESLSTTITGAFAVISLKYPLAGSYTDNGGTNMQQNRLYPGVVNINKLTIRLVNDFGNLIDLNGDDWTLTLTCDIKYDKTRS